MKKETGVRGAGHRRGRRDEEGDEPGENHTVLFCLNVPIHVPDTELPLSQPPSDLGTRPDSGYIWVGPRTLMGLIWLPRKAKVGHQPFAQ